MTTDISNVMAPISAKFDSTSSPTPSRESAGEKPAAKQWNTKNLGLRLASDFVGAASAACMVAPIITIIDKYDSYCIRWYELTFLGGIMENASGRNTLPASIAGSLKNLVTRPHTLVFSKPFALICMLYGGTYLTANTLDTITATVENKPATLVTAGTLKFAASSTANIGLCLFKDQAFARMFGPGGAPRPVPPVSFALFAARDCLTIFASFNVPPLLGPVLSRKLGEEWNKKVSGQTVAQFAAPAAVQLISTPLHLLGLDLYNRNNVTWGDRWHIVKKNWGISAAARICRIVPAFGVGGVVNKRVRDNLMTKLS